MGKTYDRIDPEQQAWLLRQKIFFVATAPVASEGHVNCSPKGGDTFRVLNEHEVAYLDLTGSGIETVAHLQENGRIVIMFCAFDGPPKIIRLHGRAEVVYPSHRDFPMLRALFPEYPGVRDIIRMTVSRVGDSCGFSVPLMSFEGDRDVLDRWAETKGPAGLDDYRQLKNRVSIDGQEGYRQLSPRS